MFISSYEIRLRKDISTKISRKAEKWVKVKFTIYEENDISKRKSKAHVKVLFKNKYGNNFEFK